MKYSVAGKVPSITLNGLIASRWIRRILHRSDNHCVEGSKVQVNDRRNLRTRINGTSSIGPC